MQFRSSHEPLQTPEQLDGRFGLVAGLYVAALLRTTYDDLTRKGGRVGIVDQEGGTTPDGIVETHAPDSPVVELVGDAGVYIKAEYSTGTPNPDRRSAI